MATLTVVTPDRDNPPEAFNGAAAAAGGDEFANTGKELLIIEHTNAGGSDMTLTVVSQNTIDGLAVADKTFTIVKGNRYVIGPFQTAYYNDVDGLVQLTYSSETDIEVAVVKPQIV